MAEMPPTAPPLVTEEELLAVCEAVYGDSLPIPVVPAADAEGDVARRDAA